MLRFGARHQGTCGGFLVREAKRLGRGNPKSGGRRSLRKIAAELAKIGEALAAKRTNGERRSQAAPRHARLRCWREPETFDDGVKLLEAAERMQLEGIVSKRRASPYRSGECNDWRKIKTVAWREANRERWRMAAPYAPILARLI